MDFIVPKSIGFFIILWYPGASAASTKSKRYTQRSALEVQIMGKDKELYDGPNRFYLVGWNFEWSKSECCNNCQNSECLKQRNYNVEPNFRVRAP